MKDFFVSIGLNVGLAVSGFFGSLLLVGKQKEHSLREQVFSIIGGTMSANYLTPIVIHYLNVQNESMTYGLAFVIGFGGLKTVELVHEKYFRKLQAKGNGDNS